MGPLGILFFVGVLGSAFMTQYFQSKDLAECKATVAKLEASSVDSDDVCDKQ